MTGILYKIFRKIKQRLFVKHLNVNISISQPELLLSKRCALITGGTSGIGYAIAESFIRAGSNAIITGRDEKKLDKSISALRDIATESQKIYGFIMDNENVSCFESFLYKIKESIAKDGISYVDILVNNAGVNCSPMPNATEEDYDRVMNINLKGAFFLSQMFGKYFVDNNIKGNILNIASASSLRPADSAYTISKWGLRGLTLGLAKSLGQYGITVNGIAPGPTATPMMIKMGNTNMALDRIPLGRYIMPEEIASMAVMLVSDAGRSIMGDIVYMTGGAGVLTYDDVKYSF